MLSLNKYEERNWYLFIGHLSFILYLIFTLVCFKERLLNCDAAYYTFHVINYEDFFVKHERYISYFTQWAPILAIKIGASLKSVLITYSAIFGVWFYALYLIVAHLWKNPKGGVLLAFALFLTMRYKHFAGHTEITFAIAVASILIIWISTDKKKLNWYSNSVDWIIKLLLIGWLYIIHPIIIIPLAVVLVADTLYTKRIKDLQHLTFFGLLLISFAVRFLTVANDSYESGKISMLSTIGSIFSSPEEYHVFTILKEYFWNEYLPVLGIFTFIILKMCKQRQWQSALALLAGSLGMYVIIAATYSYLRGNIYIMIDGYLGMFGMIWGYAIYRYILERNYKPWHVWLTLLLMIYSQVRILEKSYLLERRLENYESTFDMHPGKSKLIMPLNFHDWDQFWYPYETPMETLMLTSLKGPQHSKTIFVDYDDKGVDAYLNQGGFFLNFYNKSDIRNLNKKYFNLPIDQLYYPVEKVPWK